MSLSLAHRGIRGLAVAAGVAYLGAYLGIALLRMAYPFELEWMEGGVLDHVRMALSGRKIYAEPSLDFVSFLYPPLYYYVAAVPAALWGLEFFPLRLVSFLSSLGCAWLIHAIVRRETGDRLSGLVSACLYVASFDRSGGWFDIARVDSLFMLLLLGGIHRVRFARTPRSLVLAGLLLGCASLVKQSALVISLPLVIQGLVWERRRAAWWTAGLFAFVALSWLVIDAIHDGWFAYYCLTVPGNHPLRPALIGAFWTHDLAPMAVAAIASLFYLGPGPREAGPDGRLFYVALALGMLGSSWSVRSALGAWHNNLFPAFAAISILAGLSLHRALQWAGGSFGIVAWALVALQFALLAYDPREHLPSPADRAAGEALVQKIRDIDGSVFVPHHGYLARRAGKRGQAHALAMGNLFVDDPGPVGRDLRRRLFLALRQRRFAAVFVESDKHYLRPIRAGYERVGPLFEDPDVFWPVTGARLRPEMLYTPIR